MMEMFGSAGIMALGVLGPLIWMLTFAPVAVYLVARWRIYKESLPPDPHLGAKLALTHFAYIAYQLVLLGLFLFIFGMMSGRESMQEGLFRTATGLLIPSVLFLVASLMALGRTNHKEMPMVGRMYIGINRFHVFAVFLVAFIVAFETFVQKDTDKDVSSFAWSFTVVYLLAMGLEILRMRDLIARRPPPPTIEPPRAP